MIVMINLDCQLDIPGKKELQAEEFSLSDWLVGKHVGQFLIVNCCRRAQVTVSDIKQVSGLELCKKCS